MKMVKGTTVLLAGITTGLFFAIMVGYGMKTENKNQPLGDTWKNEAPVEPPYVEEIMPNDGEGKEEPMNQIVASSYQDALDKAKKHDKKILIIFHADWCHWCTKMENETLNDQAVKDMMKNYVFLSVDTDKDKQTAGMYEVHGLPSYVVANSNGRKLKNGSGYKVSKDFVIWLQSKEKKPIHMRRL